MVGIVPLCVLRHTGVQFVCMVRALQRMTAVKSPQILAGFLQSHNSIFCYLAYSYCEILFGSTHVLRSCTNDNYCSKLRVLPHE